MTKKYELTHETMKFYADSDDVYTLYRIRALKDFSDVKKGDLGGWVESEINLSQKGDCWIYDNATVFKNAHISDNASVHDEASVRSGSIIQDNTRILNQAIVLGRYAHVEGNSIIKDNVIIQNAMLSNCNISDEVKILGTAMLTNVHASDNAVIRPLSVLVLYNFHIGKDAYIQTNLDVLSIYMTIDRYPDHYYFYKKRNDGINVICCSYHGKISDFKKEIKDRYFGRIPPNIASMLNMVREYFCLNRLENNSKERHD